MTDVTPHRPEGVTMYAAERQQAMARRIVEQRRLSVAALADEFDVTTETVRRDLSSLERLGLIRRVHGGAVPVGTLASVESGVLERDGVNADAKDRIAHAALAQLPPDDATCLIDAGSSTARLAAALPRERRLTAFTHSVPVAARLATLPAIDLHLLPGRVRPTTQAAVGAETVAALGRLRADVCFLGTNALSAERGCTTPDPDEAAVKRALVHAARRVVVLADAGKLGGDSTVCFARPEEIDVVVTDAAADPRDVAALEAAGIEVVLA